MEKKYYYIDSKGTQFGPLTINELIGAGIRPDTYVWRAGLSEWKLAKDLPEVASYLNAVPQATSLPSLGNTVPGNYSTNGGGANSTNRPQEPMPSTYLGWSIAATFLCCLPAGIVAIIFASQVSSKWACGDYAGAKRSASLAKTWF